MRHFLLISSILLSSSVFAQDSWTSEDKKQHFVVGAVLGSTALVVTKSETIGYLVGCGTGLAKEAYDQQHKNRHTPSGKDFAVTCLGAVVGVKATGWAFHRRGISYTASF